MTTTDGNGFSTKEVLLRMEAKLDAHLIESAQAHAAFMQRMEESDRRFAMHAADDHSDIVRRLEDQSIREQGRKDVMKYIFGSSVIGLICGVGGLAIGLVKLLNG